MAESRLKEKEGEVLEKRETGKGGSAGLHAVQLYNYMMMYGKFNTARLLSISHKYQIITTKQASSYHIVDF